MFVVDVQLGLHVSPLTTGAVWDSVTYLDAWLGVTEDCLVLLGLEVSGLGGTQRGLPLLSKEKGRVVGKGICKGGI